MTDIEFLRRQIMTWCSGEALERFERLAAEHERLQQDCTLMHEVLLEAGLIRQS